MKYLITPNLDGLDPDEKAWSQTLLAKGIVPGGVVIIADTAEEAFKVAVSEAGVATNVEYEVVGFVTEVEAEIFSLTEVVKAH